MAAGLRIAKLQLDKREDVWDSVLQTDEIKGEVLNHKGQKHDG